MGASVALIACPHRAPPTVLPSVAVSQVPAGCQQNLSGPYVHSVNPSFHYQGVDDGGTLVLAVMRSGPDAGAGLMADPGSTRLVLARKPEGFAGFTYSTQLNEAQRPCPLTLPTTVLGCDDGGLRLRSVDRARVGPNCEKPEGAAPESWAEHALLRANTP